MLDFQEKYLNKSMVSMSKIESDAELSEIKTLIENHVGYTGSPIGKKVLGDWENYSARLTKIIPNDYKLMMENIEKARGLGYSGDDALKYAFDQRYK